VENPYLALIDLQRKMNEEKEKPESNDEYRQALTNAIAALDVVKPFW
jgi:hypothetical protein